MRRWLLGGVVLVVAVVALVLALGGTLSHTSGHDSSVLAAAHRGRASSGAHGHAHDPTAGDRHGAPGLSSPPPLTPVVGRPSGPGEKALQSSLDRALASAGPHVGIGVLVYDLSDRRVLFAVRPTVARPPASVEKLWTTTAVLERLGPGARLHTTVLGTGEQRGSVWHGDLYLRGGGDPTFGDSGFNDVWNHGEGADASALVAQLQRHGIRRVTGRLYADESLFDDHRGGLITHLKADIPDFGGQLSALTYDHGTTLRHFTPATFAAHEVALTMRAEGIRVTAASRSRRTPDDATLLASVASPTMAQLLRLMDVPSDDFFAELLTDQLGAVFGHGGSIASGAAVISSTIAGDFDLHPRIRDGSGLGIVDRTSPLEIVELLRDLWDTPIGRELAAALPTTGVNGTVQGIGAHTPAQGRCVAKTGSLNNVTNLAGECDARGHQEIAFGIFIDGPGNATGFAVEGRMVGAIARY